MSETKPRSSQDLIRQIETALASNPALPGALADDVEQLKLQIEDAWSAGRRDKAKRVFSVAMSIIKTGSADKE